MRPPRRLCAPSCRSIGRFAAGIGSLLLCVFLIGCASSYAVPGRGADMRAFGAARDQASDVSIVQAIDKKPLATLPAVIAAVRVQAPGYHSDTVETYGQGAYTIVTTRDVETLDKKNRFDPLEKLPGITAVVPLNRLLLPQELRSDLELRQAAASLHADMLLVYTLDTTFHVEDVAAPLTIVTLGLSPNQQARVTTTASAVLMDTRNGYVYGAAEATEKGTQLARGWTNSAAVEQTRRRTEAAAVESLVKRLQETWAGVARNLAAAPASSEVPVVRPASALTQ